MSPFSPDPPALAADGKLMSQERTPGGASHVPDDVVSGGSGGPSAWPAHRALRVRMERGCRRIHTRIIPAEDPRPAEKDPYLLRSQRHQGYGAMNPPAPYPISELEARLGADRLERDVPLAPLTTFRIGGPADLLFRASSEDDLITAVQAARELDVPHFVLGLGANILVGDRGYRGLVIRSEIADIQFLEEDGVRAGSGVVVFPDLIEATVERGLGGLHHFVGIPSTVGGAMWQNLHFLSPAPERSRTVFLEEVVDSAEILTEEGRRETVTVDHFEFGYDYSVLHERDEIVLSVVFALKPEPRESLRRIMEENLEWRASRHPDVGVLPSAGSIFQKIEGVGAGRLIDECGLKGERRGGAQIFTGHANIVVNRGDATAADVRALIYLARESVREETGHELVPEITLVGEF